MGTVANALEWSVAARTLHGEATSGDVSIVAAFPDGALVAVVDGLGHGVEAARAAHLAAAELEKHPHESVIGLVRRTHTALRGTRGVVMSLASFNTADDTMTWLGVGNVEGILIRARRGGAPFRENVLLRGGVVGYDLPPLQAFVVTVADGDTLALATDGLRAEFTTGVSCDVPPAKQADELLSRYAKDTDDALVLVARYRGRRSDGADRHVG